MTKSNVVEKRMNPHSLFCLNRGCPSRGRQNAGNLLVHDSLTQRYRCKTCDTTFVANKGTLFYRLKTDPQVVVQVLTLLALGCPVTAIVRAFAVDARSVRSWQKKAGQHCQAVHTDQVTNKNLDLEYVQADEVRVRLQKRLVVWRAMAICVSSRLWLGGVVSVHRDRKLLQSLARLVKSCARFAPLLLVTDGWGGYPAAWQRAFRTPVKTGKRGNPALLPWPDVVIAPVVKERVKGRVSGLRVCHLAGAYSQIKTLLPQGQGRATAYIERLNATFRARLGCLCRRPRSLALLAQTVEGGMYLVGCVYHFCTPHQSLSKAFPTTPAMAAGLTDHVWTLGELLCLRRVPSPFLAPKRRGRKPKSEAQNQEGARQLLTV
jgi:transposase-like protein